MHLHKGFTLIEMMIVVAIVGILAMIVYPSYVNHVQSTSRSEGMQTLQIVAGQQEVFANNNNGQYSDDLAGDGLTTAGVTGKYTITVNEDAGLTYTLTASPTGWTDDLCGNLTLRNTGVRGVTGDPDGDTIDGDGADADLDDVALCWE